MISRELFVESLARIRKQETRCQEFTDALAKFCDGHPLFDVNNQYLFALLQLLEELMNDRSDLISWWLYEDVEHVVYVKEDGEERAYNLEEPDALYNFLVMDAKYAPDAKLPIRESEGEDAGIEKKLIEVADFQIHFDAVLNYVENHPSTMLYITEEGQERCVLMGTEAFNATPLGNKGRS